MNQKEIDKRIIKISKKLRLLRKQKGFKSYDNFSKVNKIPKIQYWKMEKGSNFTMNSLLRVLDAHNITLDEFFKDIK